MTIFLNHESWTIHLARIHKYRREAGKLSEDEINEHVHRVLRTIFATGLFDHPVVRQVPDIEGGYRAANGGRVRCA